VLAGTANPSEDDPYCAIRQPLCAAAPPESCAPESQGLGGGITRERTVVEHDDFFKVDDLVRSRRLEEPSIYETRNKQN
jgi:hypothetical protein